MDRVKRKPWEFYYNLCKDYYRENNSLNIPRKYIVTVDDNGIKLGEWLNNQRRRKDTLSDERQKLLEDIGIVWKVKDWDNFYNILVDYKKEFGHTDVKQVEIYGGVRLGQWVISQRNKYSNGELSKDRIKKLESIGFHWNSVPTEKYRHYLLLMKDYQNKNGHLLVGVNEKYKGEELGKYVARLRRFYRLGKISPEKITELESVGMKWDGREAYWAYNYELCCEYVANGNNVVPTTEYNGFKIGSWLSRQRTEYKNGKLSNEQAEAIEKLLKDMSSVKKVTKRDKLMYSLSIS